LALNKIPFPYQLVYLILINEENIFSFARKDHS
jgi:hypothetical protein